MSEKKDFRNYALKDKNIRGHLFDSYVEKVESMTRAVIEERPTNFREIDVFSRLIWEFSASDLVPSGLLANFDVVNFFKYLLVIIPYTQFSMNHLLVVDL